MLVFLQYLFSMFFVQGVSDFITESPADTIDSDQVRRLLAAFGSVQASVLSLFMATTGGEDWANYYRLLRITGPWRAWVFVFYIAFFMVAALNIVTGTFVSKASTLATPDTEAIMRDKFRQDTIDAKHFKKVFYKANKSNHNELTLS